MHGHLAFTRDLAVSYEWNMRRLHSRSATVKYPVPVIESDFFRGLEGIPRRISKRFSEAFPFLSDSFHIPSFLARFGPYGNN